MVADRVAESVPGHPLSEAIRSLRAMVLRVAVVVAELHLHEERQCPQRVVYCLGPVSPAEALSVELGHLLQQDQPPQALEVRALPGRSIAQILIRSFIAGAERSRRKPLRLSKNKTKK